MFQLSFWSKFLPIWLQLYHVERVLTNSNYKFRKIGTNYTQCVHRIRLRPVVDDLTQIDPDKFQRDPMLGPFRGEPLAALVLLFIPTLLLPPSEELCVEVKKSLHCSQFRLIFLLHQLLFRWDQLHGRQFHPYQLQQRLQQLPHCQLRTKRWNNNQRLWHILKINNRFSALST